MYYTIIRTLEQSGYHKSSIKLNNADAYFKCDEDKNSMIVIAKARNANIYNEVAAQNLRVRYAQKAMGFDLEDIVLVVLGIDGLLKDFGENTISINSITGEIAKEHIRRTKEKEFLLLKKCSEIKKTSYKKHCADVKANGSHFEKNTWFLWVVMILNVVITFKTGTNYNYELGLNPYFVLVDGQYYRLFSYMFLHASLMHILSNSVSLYLMGNDYMKRVGAVRFTVVYILSGVFSGLVSVYWHAFTQPDVIVFTTGASGAIFGLLGAQLYESFTSSDKTEKDRMIKYCIIVLVLNNIGSQVDRACHIGGFIMGFAFAFITAAIVEIYENKKYIKYAFKERDLKKNI